MGFLPSTVAAITQLEIELAAYFGGMGKGNRGYVVLQLSDILTGLTADATYGAIATAWNAEVAASVAATSPGTQALTTSSTDVLTGSQGDDIFTGVFNLLSTKTLSVTDKIDGGTGNDTLKINVSSAFGGFTTGSVAGVEVIEITNDLSASTTFDATGIAGATTYTLNNANGALTVSDMQTGVRTINLNGQKTGTFSTAFEAGTAEIASTTIAGAFNINTVGTYLAGVVDTTVSVNLGDFDTVNITATGDNSISMTSAPKAITVAGAGKLNISGIQPGLTSYDASAATGAVTAVLTGVTAAAALLSVKGGSGADLITVDEIDLRGNATISGGAGTDRLTMTSNGGAVEFAMTGFETLALSSVTTDTLIFSGTNTTDLAAVTMTTATSTNVDMVNMGSGNLTFTATGAVIDSGAGVDFSSDHSGTTSLTYAALTANSTAKTSSLPLKDFSFTKTSALTVNVNAYVDNAGSDITAEKAASVTLNVASSKDETGNTERSIFGSTITAEKATAFTVAASGSLASTSTYSGAVTKTVDITATGGTINLSTPLATSVKSSSTGAFTIASSTASSAGVAKVETVELTATSGATTFSEALPVAGSIKLAGTATSSAVTLGNLGSITKASDVNITATGLKAGLTVGTIDVAPGYDVNITVDGVGASAGATSIGAIGSGAGTSDDVTISAKAIAGALTVGHVTVAGNVSIVATDAVGTVTVNNVTGNNVTVNLANSAAASNVAGAITAKTSAAVTYNSLAITSETIAASADSTALAVALTTGIQADTVTITGGAAQTSITVTGNMGASSDTLVVSSPTASAQTIDISALQNYEFATLSTKTNAGGADTIIGGAGVDTIYSSRGQDTLTGNGGADIFRFSQGDSPYTAPDTITDLGATDKVYFNGAAASIATQVNAAAAGVATITSGIATFALTTTATAKDTLNEVVGLIDAATNVLGASALFTFEGSTYMYIQGAASAGTVDSSDVVIKLTGVVLGTVTLATVDSPASGLTGFGTA